MPLNELAALLEVPEDRLDVLRPYDEAQIDAFAAAIRSRMAADKAAVDAGLEDAVRFVPRPLRGAARRVLFAGGGHG